jgi:IclR family acetate operon transcriptional repressor
MPEPFPKKSPDAVASIGRALKVLELFAGFESAIRLRNVSSALRLPPSSAHRLLASLSQYGYVRYDPKSHAYFMGEALFALARSLQHEVALRDGVQRELRELIDRTNGSTSLAILRDARAHFVDVLHKPGALARPEVGFSASLTTTATGRALLAASPVDLDALVRSKRIIAGPAFLREIEEVRTRGFASSFGETVKGVSAVASAIVSQSGRVYGALDVVIFGEPIFRDRLVSIAGALRASCARVAEGLP